uniref:Uncharacterized protein n=1 Tax=Steinernema glaseri TaxID=37863 RepID=A0A1I7YBU0_9BILA
MGAFQAPSLSVIVLRSQKSICPGDKMRLTGSRESKHGVLRSKWLSSKTPSARSFEDYLHSAVAFQNRCLFCFWCGYIRSDMDKWVHWGRSCYKDRRQRDAVQFLSSAATCGPNPSASPKLIYNRITRK